MSAKMLDDILVKEKNTAQNEAEASQNANTIVEQAKQNAFTIIEESKTQAKDYEDRQLKAAGENSDALVLAAVSQAEDIAVGFRKIADEKFSEAVGVVRGIIVE